METHLRLAERQGLLQGKHISPVQAHALVLLRFLDAKDLRRMRTDAVKAALVSSGAASVRDLWPEWFEDEDEEPTEEGTEAEEEGAAYDYSDVEWKTGGDAISEYERLMSQVSQNSKVTITAESTGGEWI